MTIPLLIILGFLWAAVLVPPLLRARSERKSGAIGDYAHSLGALKTSNRTIRSMPRTAAGLVDGNMHRAQKPMMTDVNKRRANVLQGLIAFVGATFFLAIAVPSMRGMFFIFCFLGLLSLGAYIYMLLQLKEKKRLKALQQNQNKGR